MNKKLKQPIFITSPIIPNMLDLQNELKTIFESKYLTNMGVKHNELEKRLKAALKIGDKNFSLFNNGTIALLVALKALNLPIGSQVITTPFTFAATAHCISWNGLNPVFCDIEPNTMCIDADKIETLITKNTSAILAVHVYGFPCDVKKINKVAKKHKLKVIYDAAHAFSTEIFGKGIGSFGDITMFSFHATKLFNTVEGGGLAYPQELSRKIGSLRNFGIQSEEFVEDIGINGKMNEIQAIFGLLNLKSFKKEQNKRAKIKQLYDDALSKIKGIRIPKMPYYASHSYQYYPIIIEKQYPITRNELYDNFKKLNIFTRKYFYPLCSDYECYKNLPSSKKENLSIANDIKNKVLCLPFYGDLPIEAAKIVCDKIQGIFKYV
ncbi:MAG: DegT/DnrJ/EryC1/StrS family aminotransferase [Elusimicrobiota bacterium]|nr:DegT/DnrJ/EryC1/StrS family aminotransferase [Elusimicrobiota bacterium]